MGDARFDEQQLNPRRKLRRQRFTKSLLTMNNHFYKGECQPAIIKVVSLRGGLVEAPLGKWLVIGKAPLGRELS